MGYNHHRYYDPKVGRYLRNDPIGFDGGINLYLYCFGNPNNLIDPRGLKNGYRPVVTFSGPREPSGAPGDDVPPKGTLIPFVGERYPELANYALRHFGYSGYSKMNEEVQRLVEIEAENIQCKDTLIYDLCFKIFSGGVDVRFMKKPEEASVYETGVKCVFKHVRGRKNCKCAENITR